jgi:hypothetical protein
VDADGNGTAGIRWYELRDSLDGNGWQIYQQGTYSPDDRHRWMGSIAMNGQGTIALGFTASSSDSIYPSIRYTGRNVNATPGEMNYQEVEVIPGTASLSYNRWGDYAMTSVDPSDDSTFWHTNEYSTGGWKTRIVSFDFGPVEPPTIDAGPDSTICELEAFYRTPIAENYKSVFWETDGDGILPNPNNLTLGYWRGNQDLENGSVNFWVTAYGYLDGMEAVDSLVLGIDTVPDVFAGPDTTICIGQPLQLNGFAMPYDSVKWTTSGDGVFDDSTSLTAIYTPGDNDTTTKKVELVLAAYNPACVETTSSMELTLDVCTGLAEEGDELFLKVYPNPSIGKFNLSISGQQQDFLDMSIRNGQGQILFNYHIDDFVGQYNNVIDMSYYSPGIYYLRISNNSFAKTVKLVKY